MKFCKAWPDACQVKLKSEFDVTTDAPVWPKALVTETVESIATKSVEALINSSFDATEESKPIAEVSKTAETIKGKKKKRKMSARSRWADDPVDVPAAAKGPSAATQTEKALERPSIAPRRSAAYYDDDDKAIWTAFAVLAVLFVVVVGSLMQRVRTLEASLHGRLTA
jgi:hypothetical protein